MRKIVKPKLLENKSFSDLKDITRKRLTKAALTGLIIFGLGGYTGSQVTSNNMEKDMNTVEFYSIKPNSENKVTLETIDGRKLTLESTTLAEEVEDLNEVKGKRHIKVFDESIGEYVDGYVDTDNLKLVKKLSRKELESYDTHYIINSNIDITTKKTLEEGSVIIGKSTVNADATTVKGLYIDENDIIDVEIPIEKINNWENINKNEVAIVRVLEKGYESLKMRENPGLKSKIITEIPNGKLVQFLEADTLTIQEDEINWRKVRYIDENGDAVEGYVSEYYLEDAKTKIVDVNEKINEGYLNVRSNSYIEDNIIDKIPSGTDVFFAESEVTDDGWVKCYYYKEGKLNEGYVSQNYLNDKGKFSNSSIEDLIIENNQEDNDRINKILNNTQINDSGYIVGIDANVLSSQKYREILEEGTFSITKDEEIQGMPGFAYIKLGATGYGSEFSFAGLMSTAEEYIKIATDNNIPYGLYYYSQVTNEEEVIKEFEEIIKLREELKSRLEYDGYVLNEELPIAIDIETYKGKNGTIGRTGGKDVTDAQIALMKKIEKEYGKAIIYTSGQWVLGEEKILDLEKYSSEIGDVDIWLVNPSNYRLKQSERESYEERLNYINDITKGRIVFMQKEQGATYKGEEIDVNRITPEMFERLLREQAQSKLLLDSRSEQDKDIMPNIKDDDEYIIG